MPSKLIVVSNRLPVTLKCTHPGGSVKQASIEDFRGFFHRKTNEDVVPSPGSQIMNDGRKVRSRATSSETVLLSPRIRARAGSNEAAQSPGAITGNTNNVPASPSTPPPAASAESSPEPAWTFTVSSGGLVSALTGLQNKGMTFDWVGWPGTDVPPSDQEHIRELIAPSNARPVFLTDAEADLHYNGFSNSVMWPLLHYQTPEMHGVYTRYEGYKVANERFADTIAASAADGDLVWVHDYHLMLLPRMLRKRLVAGGGGKGAGAEQQGAKKPQIRIGFFLHTSFPSSDVFRMLPMRAELLEGVLGADYVAFHTYDYARHFLSACQRVLGLDAVGGSGVRVGHRTVRIAVHPIGIEPEKFISALTTDATVSARLAALRASFTAAGRRVILGVDRMDYIKGIPQKLLAFERFLRDNPAARGGKVTLVQICVPSRQDVPEYQELAAQVDGLVGRLNGTYGTPAACPVHYLHRSVPFPDLVALYAVAEVCFITSLRDGMNLVSYEYVATQGGVAGWPVDATAPGSSPPAAAEILADPARTPGVLVLSEFAGAANSFDGALTVNPHNTDQVAETLALALAMEPAARIAAHHKLMAYVAEHTAARWGLGFVNELSAGSGATGNGIEVDAAGIQSRWTEAAAAKDGGAGRVLLVDYDGGVRGLGGERADAAPVSATKALLALSAQPHTHVYVISGRSRADLTARFPDAPTLGLVAEHGIFVRHPSRDGRPGAWLLTGPSSDTPAGEPGSAPAPAWMALANPVLAHYTSRTPGSSVDCKEASVAWHFRAADPEFGEWQAPRVRSALSAALVAAGVEVATGERAVEVRPRGGVGAGTAVARRFSGSADGSAGGSTGGGQGPGGAQGPGGGDGAALPAFTVAILNSISMVDGVGESLQRGLFGVPDDPRCITCTVGGGDGSGFYIRDQEAVVELLTRLAGAAE